MRSGAKAFLLKPAAPTPEHVASFIRNVARLARQYAAPPASAAGGQTGLIAIGASTGGTEAIYYLLQMLPPNVPGIVIVQHIPPVFSRMFAERLNQATRFEAREAETGDEIKSGIVLVAPGDRHLKVVRSGGRLKADCSKGEKVSGHIPSVDILFGSVAACAGPESIGILLTGMGQDGARGLLAMRQAGARTIVQDEQTSVVYGMPKAAYELGAAEFRRPIGEIAALVGSLRQS
ncbi:CheB methylesterase domain-containing protein [Cohnella rhizosphaerae]|uniref:protein-glutamate methylesterase n=1 Tax=Cohnella rhizosphaerae TaxID=1457232 RepID=A0A9X4KZY3_9BACL|nr:CheB methylesterase domain-containing protein [Cohnella rhizosphaerae]MDG0813668.1 CheB methylesterase domain-containing protein [Cohnella rhizosphaerae]